MPRKAKRHDPDDSPVDGVYRADRITNQRKGYRCFLLNEEDAAVKRAQGAVKVARGSEGPRPFYYFGSDSDTGYTNRGLTLYEMPEELARKHEQSITAEAAQRMAIIRQEAI